MAGDTQPPVKSSVDFAAGIQLRHLQTAMGWNDRDLARALNLRVNVAKELVTGSSNLRGAEHIIATLEECGQILPQGTATMLKLVTGCLYPNQWEVFGENDGLALLAWFVRLSGLPIEDRQVWQDKIDNLAKGLANTIRGTTPDGATE